MKTDTLDALGDEESALYRRTLRGVAETARH